MRILLLNQVFYPDVAATAQHAHDLARHLTGEGHEVVVIASRSIYGEKGATLPRHELVDGIRIHRVGVSLFGKAGLLARLFDFVLFYLAAAIKAFSIRRPDVVVCFTTPPFVGSIGWMLRTLRGSRYVYWAMDLYPDVLVAGGMLRPRSLLTRMLARFNRSLMRSADRVVVLGRCMQDRVCNQGVSEEQVACIGVWSDHEEVRPIAREDNAYRSEWSLGDRFIVMYAGNFGLVHDVETMCGAAERLKNDDHIAFAFVGGGKRKAEVEAYVAQHHLKAIIAPYQPRERLDVMLSCGDVHIVSLKPGYEGIVVPSKLFGIMAAGRPTIFIGPPESEVARVLCEQSCGIVIQPGDVDGLVNAIRKLADDPEGCRTMGENARHALQRTYDRQHACAAWQRLLEDLVPTVTGRSATGAANPAAAPQGNTDASA